jgi:hypothetical protein
VSGLNFFAKLVRIQTSTVSSHIKLISKSLLGDNMEDNYDPNEFYKKLMEQVHTSDEHYKTLAEVLRSKDIVEGTIVEWVSDSPSSAGESFSPLKHEVRNYKLEDARDAEYSENTVCVFSFGASKDSEKLELKRFGRVYREPGMNYGAMISSGALKKGIPLIAHCPISPSDSAVQEEVGYGSSSASLGALERGYILRAVEVPGENAAKIELFERHF